MLSVSLLSCPPSPVTSCPRHTAWARQRISKTFRTSITSFLIGFPLDRLVIRVSASCQPSRGHIHTVYQGFAWVLCVCSCIVCVVFSFSRLRVCRRRWVIGGDYMTTYKKSTFCLCFCFVFFSKTKLFFFFYLVTLFYHFFFKNIIMSKDFSLYT